MKITADTNLPIRAVIPGDPHQAREVVKALRPIQLEYLLLFFCEFVWCFVAVTEIGFGSPTQFIGRFVTVLRP